MTSPGDISRLLADIATAMDEAHITDLLADSLEPLAALPLRQREQAGSRIQDAIREWRAFDDDRSAAGK